MNNPLKSPAAAQLGLLLVRLPLGFTFLFAGTEKLTRIGVNHFVDTATGLLPEFLPKPIGQTYLYAVPFFEVTVGLLLIFGLFTRSAATVASLMLLSFIIAATGVFIDGNVLHIQFNVLYFGIGLLLMTTGGGKISLDRAFFGDQDGMRR